MPANSSIILDGLLKPDGTLELNGCPDLAPGPVRVRLESVPKDGAQPQRLPAPPFLDESIPAPVDLPRPGNSERVKVREAAGRLPEQHDLENVEAA